MTTRAAREARIRRAAARQGLALKKSRCRKMESRVDDAYRLVNPYTNYVVHGHQGFGSSLDAIEEYFALDA